MDDLVEWLRGQLDEDEQIALTWPADQRNWDEYGDRRIDYASGAGEEVSAVNVKANAALGWERIYVKRDVIGLSRHVAEHDPARVLREIDADRELLAEYGRLLDAHAAHQREAARLAEAGDDADVIQVAALRREADYLPAMLHVLERWAKRKATVYADRPGYREEWRP